MKVIFYVEKRAFFVVRYSKIKFHTIDHFTSYSS